MRWIPPWLIGCTLLVACGESARPSSPSAAPSTSAASVAPTASVAPSASAATSSAPAASSSVAPIAPAASARAEVVCDRLRWAPGVCWTDATEAPGAGERVVASDWLRARGVGEGAIQAREAGLVLGEGCRAVAARPAGEEILACWATTQLRSPADAAVYRQIDRLRVLTVRKGQPVTLLDAPVAVANFDDGPVPVQPGATRPSRERALMALVVDLREAGSRVVVREPSPGACAAASKGRDADLAAANADRGPGGATVRAMAELDRRALSVVCAMVGDYTHSRGAYVRSGGPHFL